MSALGIQLTGALVIVFVLWRLKTILHLPHRILAGLRYYHLPTDETLISLFNLQTKPSGRTKRDEPASNRKTEATILKSDLADVTLSQSEIRVPGMGESGLLSSRHSYSSFENMILFAAAAILILLFARAYMAISTRGSREGDFGAVFLIIGLAIVIQSVFTATLRFQLTRWEVQGATVIGLLTFILCSGLFAASDSGLLAFDLYPAYTSLRDLFHAAVTNLDLANTLEFKLTYRSFQVSICLLCCFCSAMLSFALFKRARLQAEAVRMSKGLSKLWLFAWYAVQWIAAVIWMLPDEMIDLPLLSSKSVRSLSGVLAALLQLLVVKLHMQAYLAEAPAAMKRTALEPGRISLAEFQRKIVPPMFHLCATAIQIVGLPLLYLLLSLALCSMGGAVYGVPFLARFNSEAALTASFWGPVFAALLNWYQLTDLLLSGSGWLYHVAVRH